MMQKIVFHKSRDVMHKILELYKSNKNVTTTTKAQTNLAHECCSLPVHRHPAKSAAGAMQRVRQRSREGWLEGEPI